MWCLAIQTSIDNARKTSQACSREANKTRNPFSPCTILVETMTRKESSSLVYSNLKMFSSFYPSLGVGTKKVSINLAGQDTSYQSFFACTSPPRYLLLLPSIFNSMLPVVAVKWKKSSESVFMRICWGKRQRDEKTGETVKLEGTHQASGVRAQGTH